MARQLRDKIVLITGASSGFGEDAAILFAKEGARVILTARRIDRLNAIVEKIEKDGGSASAIALDVSHPDQIRSVVSSVKQRFGRIDILFNNAGFGKINFLENLDLENDIIPTINVNLIGAIELVRQVLPIMIDQGDGHIINMSSVAGWIATTPYSVYAATKYGLRGFNDALRREVRHHGVRVSGIYPGPATTEFADHVGWDHKKASTEQFKLSSMTSEFVAKKVVGLAKHPRRTLVLPWYFNILIWFSILFPGLTDLLIVNVFSKRVYPKKGTLHVKE